MDRIAHAFEIARSQNRAALIGYLCAGDPDYATSLAACTALLENGVDLLEVGMPFSDPLADGLTNQLAAQRALQSGMTVAQCFDLVAALRKRTTKPIVFYTYYNLVFTNGISRFMQQARAAGLDGLLTLDLPPEESEEVVAASRAEGLSNIFIVAPTTPESRLETIARHAGGFLYYVSREGVTGVRSTLATNIPEAVAAIRRHTPLPVAVGFGISTADQVREVAASADGVVVGSALVNCIARNIGAPENAISELAATARTLAAGLGRAS